MSNPVPTLETLINACGMPQKGERRYARVALESGLQVAFIRTNGRRNEPLEAWYVTSADGKLRISEAQVPSLLKLWSGAEISTVQG
jgi:hypothetical protein